MKIALCFSGQARALAQGHSYYKKNLLSIFDVDVYVHSWNSDQNQLYLDLYEPKRFVFEDRLENVFDEKYGHRTPNIKRHPPFATASMFYSLYQSGELIKGSYDWVIRARTDFALNRVIPFAELDRSKLYIPNDVVRPERDGGNDQFAFGAQDIMRKYMSTYMWMDDYFQAGAVFIGEDLMRANLIAQGLVGDRLAYFDMHNPFYKGRYDGMRNSLIRDDYSKWLGFRERITFREIKGRFRRFMDGIFDR